MDRLLLTHTDMLIARAMDIIGIRDRRRLKRILSLPLGMTSGGKQLLNAKDFPLSELPTVRAALGVKS